MRIEILTALLLASFANAGEPAIDGEHPGMSAGRIADEIVPPGLSPDLMPPPLQRPRACPKEEAINGVDISHHQGKVNFTGLHTAQEFIFIKATEGARHVDATFARNWAQAGSKKMLRGAYHYFLPDQDPVAQARHFASTIKLSPETDLPPVLDWEQITDLAPEKNAAAGKAFLKELERITNATPILYTSPGYWRRLGEPSGFSRYPLFIAQYGVNCPEKLKNLRQWEFWQKSETGQSPGVTGQVDIDVFQGTRDLLWVVRSFWTHFFYDFDTAPSVDAFNS